MFAGYTDAERTQMGEELSRLLPATVPGEVAVAALGWIEGFEEVNGPLPPTHPLKRLEQALRGL